MRRPILMAGIALLFLPATLSSQRAPGRPAQRGALEERFRERLGAVMRERLGLNDEQLRRLSEVNRKFEDQRRTLFREELDVRRGMRLALHEDSLARQDSVAGLLDRVLRMERQKVDLFEAEQRELAQFLTPIQRARYIGIQEQLRRQMDEMRDRRGTDGPKDRPASGMRRPRRPPGSP